MATDRGERRRPGPPAQPRRRRTAGGWSPGRSPRAASPTSSRSRAATCSRSTTAAASEGIRIVDTRHEQAAAWAAEGWAKATREAGVCALTAGPGVTNGISAIAGPQCEPLAAGRARRPRARDALGLGLAAGDRPRPDRRADHQVGGDGQATPTPIPEATCRATRRRDRAAVRPHLRRLPARRRLPGGRGRVPAAPGAAARQPADGRREAAELLAARRAPRDHGRHRALLGPRRGRAAGAGRGARSARRSSTAWAAAACPPTTSSASAAPAAQGLKEADVALVSASRSTSASGSAARFGEETKLIWLDSAPNALTANRRPEIELVGDIAATLAAMREGAAAAGARPRPHPWLGRGAARRPRPRSATARRPSSTTTALRCIRCGSTASSARCSTATRS